MSERRDNFENGVFWEIYKDLEHQFENFLDYVPYLEGNENVYSFKLLNLILSIGGHVDSAFKEMARYPKFSGNKECQEILGKLKESEVRKEEGKGPIPVAISLPLEAFENEYKLSARKVKFKLTPEKPIAPFTPHNPNTNAPKWWESYNALKHDVGVNIGLANLKTTLNALAGAFLLNAIHYPSVSMLHKYGVIKIEFERTAYETVLHESASSEWVKQRYEETGNLPTTLETPLFIYDYKGWEEVS